MNNTTRKAGANMANTTRKAGTNGAKKAPKRFVVKKGLMGGRLIDEVNRFLKFKGITGAALVESIARQPNGSLKRTKKNIGPFSFIVDPVGGIPELGNCFIGINYKDGHPRDGMIQDYRSFVARSSGY